MNDLDEVLLRLESGELTEADREVLRRTLADPDGRARVI